MKDSIYISKIENKVLVHTTTYNQANYITDTLEGVAMQQTNFPFVHYVIDDCSTDGEQDVIKAWLDEHCDMEKAEYIDLDLAHIIIVDNETNPNCHYAIYFLKTNLYKEESLKNTLVNPWRNNVEYEAFCEGDDYWTDPLKLQKQVDVMDAHPECTICFNRVQTINAHDNAPLFMIPPQGRLKTGFVSLNDLMQVECVENTWCFHTSSFFIRTEFMSDYTKFKKEILPSFPYGDMPMEMYFLNKGGYFLEDVMGCYRWLSGGYNSNLNSNFELKKKMEFLVIDGFREFDEWTKKKWHEEVETLITRKLFVLDGEFSLKKKYRYLMKKNFRNNPYNFFYYGTRKYLPWLFFLLSQLKKKL